MKEYQVTIPIAGAICVCVEAENEEQAKEIASDKDWYFEIEGNDKRDIELLEIETYEHVNRGNVCYLSYWNIEVEES